jgi:hypothetical protein
MPIYSKLLHLVKAALLEDPSSIDITYTSYGVTKTLLTYVLENGYPRSVIKFLLDSGAKATMHNVSMTKCWITKRMILQHIPSIAMNAHLQHYTYMKAPKKEWRWFEDFTRQRIRFVLSVTPELLERARAVDATPPLRVREGITIPGRQGYHDALADARLLHPFCDEKEEPVLSPPLLDLDPQVEEVSPRKRNRSPYYNHPLWPSPRAKRYVLALKNEWNFATSWKTCGLGALTHDNCLTYMAYILGVSLEFLLQMPHDDMEGALRFSLNCYRYVPTLDTN